MGAGTGARGARAGSARAVVRRSAGSPGVDARAVAQAAAAFDALARLQDLTQRVLAELDRETGASSSAAPADLDDLHVRWESAWRSWREGLASRAANGSAQQIVPVYVYSLVGRPATSILCELASAAKQYAGGRVRSGPYRVCRSPPWRVTHPPEQT